MNCLRFELSPCTFDEEARSNQLLLLILLAALVGEFFNSRFIHARNENCP